MTGKLVGIQAGSRPAKAKQVHDDCVMGTNNSSIVSKRSVERLYFPDEAHFFRHFVKKPQRRSPLINRGYWLRMKAIDNVVQQFLERPSDKKKIVINLGCGYDPLPWQCLTRYSSACEGVIFIDIDHKELMIKKKSVVINTNQLHSMLTNVKNLDGDILLQSDQYIQLGCDLRDLVHLRKLLESVIDVKNCLILFTAEVSITYMDVESADALIAWLGTIDHAQFCLLEQLLPGGPEHPFALTMMAHFEKLRTPLRPVLQYPTVFTQEERFRRLGWQNAVARNLWELWSATDSITAEERRSLDSVEPFDEWEEFALFGCHYVLLVANTCNMKPIRQPIQEKPIHPTWEQLLLAGVGPSRYIDVTFSENLKGVGFKRFASPILLQNLEAGIEVLGNYAGMGLHTRVSTMDIYTADGFETKNGTFAQGFPVPSNRMCHTSTDLAEAGCLLVGGRTSPDTAFADCWLYHKWLGIWERVADLPQPLYRHGAVYLGQGEVLISTGRINSFTISNDYMVWSRRKGWVHCVYGEGERPPALYGAVFVANTIEQLPESHLRRGGIISGGISRDGFIQDACWQWEIDNVQTTPVITFRRITHSCDIARFGASTGLHNGKVYIIGGVARDNIIQACDEVMCYSVDDKECLTSPVPLAYEHKTPRPLMIGTTVSPFDNGLIIMGGGAVCFSFGTYWNKGCYTVHIPDSTNSSSHHEPSTFRFTQTLGPYMDTSSYSVLSPAKETTQVTTQARRLRIGSEADFLQAMQSGRPVILEGLDIGPCTSKWTSSYLKEQVGANREVVVHEATTEHMDFSSKNFSYVTKTFEQFVDEIERGERLYLRALSLEKPSELPAELSTDFPNIATDFRLPPEVAVIMHTAHSSPLRISGPVNMWLHYDVMANVLFQVRGTKKLILFPPSDVKHFGFEPGASSSSADVFNNLGAYMHSHPQEAQLQPGDALFLPPLWLHAASPTSAVSIGVNVFFRSLSSGYAAGKDVYGNRDLQAYEKGRQVITRIIKSFDGLPADVRGFYLQRLVDEFQRIAQ